MEQRIKVEVNYLNAAVKIVLSLHPTASFLW